MFGVSLDLFDVVLLSASIPSNAVFDESGNALVDESGKYITTE